MGCLFVSNKAMRIFARCMKNDMTLPFSILLIKGVVRVRSGRGLNGRWVIPIRRQIRLLDDLFAFVPCLRLRSPARALWLGGLGADDASEPKPAS